MCLISKSQEGTAAWGGNAAGALRPGWLSGSQHERVDRLHGRALGFKISRRGGLGEEDEKFAGGGFGVHLDGNR